MKVKTIIGDVNYADIVATAEMGEANLTPPDHVVNVARLAIANPNTEVSDDVAAYVGDWLAQQANLQAQVGDIIARLEAVAPLPTPEQLISGNPDWPTWMGTWWATTLRFDWAGRLGEAIIEAWEWLDGKP